MERTDQPSAEPLDRPSSSRPLRQAAHDTSAGRTRRSLGTLRPETTTHRPAPSEAELATAMFREPFANKWGRRLVTIPGLSLLTALYGAALPLLLVYGVVYDRLKGRRNLLARFHLYIFAILAWHLIGLAILAGAWLAAPPRLTSLKRRLELGRRVELWFIPRAIAIAERIYNMTLEIEGAECVAPGPVLVLSRHASVLDTIMPIKLLGQAHGMITRIVQKHELLADPLVDIASYRQPRAFVKRGTGNARGQLKHLLALQSGMSERDALVIFPEGSRFSQEKKDRIVAKLAESNPAAAARAAQLQFVLPVRPMGTLALLEARPDMDVVFLAHTGLEGAHSLDKFINGALLDRALKVKFWRVAAKDIPAGEDERTEWLQRQWDLMDAWIAEHRVP